MKQRRTRKNEIFKVKKLLRPPQKLNLIVHCVATGVSLSIITQTPETLMDNVIGWGGRDRTCE